MFDRPPTPSTAQIMADRVVVRQWWAQSLFFVLPTEMAKKKGRGGLTCVQGVIPRRILFIIDIPFLADWNKIGDYRQSQTDRNAERENSKRINYDYKVGDKVLIVKEGILRKAESRYGKEPWTITTVHTNGTIRVQCRSKSERINIRRVTPFSEDIL